MIFGKILCLTSFVAKRNEWEQASTIATIATNATNATGIIVVILQVTSVIPLDILKVSSFIEIKRKGQVIRIHLFLPWCFYIK